MESVISRLPSLRPSTDSTANVCAVCRHWRELDPKTTAGEAAGLCERFPPTVQLVPNPRPMIGQPPLMPVLLRPTTPGAMTCGEFALRI